MLTRACTDCGRPVSVTQVSGREWLGVCPACWRGRRICSTCERPYGADLARCPYCYCTCTCHDLSGDCGCCYHDDA